MRAGDLTQIIQCAIEGDPLAEKQVCDAVYRELHAVARRLLGDREHSLQPTMLVHDVFMRLFRRQGLKQAPSRRYFYAVAGDQMRKLLIDHHRRRTSLKAGGGWKRSPLEVILDRALGDLRDRNGCDIEALNLALQHLRGDSPRQHEVVMHRFFEGLTFREIAELLDVCISTVERDWRLARAKLHHYLSSRSLLESGADHVARITTPAN